MSDLQEWLSAIREVGLPNVFNPYGSMCPVFDLDGAALVRFRMLSQLAERAESTGVDSVWIGRDLGYRGGRRTGLALTDDIHLESHLRRWGIAAPPPFLKGQAVAERTACVVWGELSRIDQKVFLWNVFPFHPHDEHDPMSNRSHSSRERAVGEELLACLLKLLRPRVVVAIGQNALASAVRCSSSELIYAVRHPSYGGKADFIRGVRSIYSGKRGDGCSGSRSGTAPTMSAVGAYGS